MVITYHGLQCFKVSFGDLTVAFNPFSKETAKKHGLKEVRFGSDVVFITTKHPDFNASENMSYGEKVPFVASGPGEYEFGELTARGYGVKTNYDGEEKYNTIYQVTLENINILFLGALSDEKLDSSILGSLPTTDILFVPIGGDSVLDAAAASALAVKLEPRIIIPMQYEKNSLSAFLKEEGSDAKPQEKLTVKKKDVLEHEGDTIIISAER